MRRIATLWREQNEARALPAKIGLVDQIGQSREQDRVSGRDRAMQKHDQRKRIFFAGIVGFVQASVSLVATGILPWA